jgi:hypothetical protein
VRELYTALEIQWASDNGPSEERHAEPEDEAEDGYTRQERGRSNRPDPARLHARPDAQSQDQSGGAVRGDEIDRAPSSTRNSPRSTSTWRD